MNNDTPSITEKYRLLEIIRKACRDLEWGAHVSGEKLGPIRDGLRAIENER